MIEISFVPQCFFVDMCRWWCVVVPSKIEKKTLLHDLYEDGYLRAASLHNQLRYLQVQFIVALLLQTHAHRKTIAANYNYQLLKLATSML
jgi:hypothetical protein